MAEGGLMAESLMAVLAHPDDETFGLGGTIATYARRGHDVYYVCATGGEIGTVDEKYLRGFRDTAELRAGELMRAAKVLGIKDVFLLGYRDSGMPNSEANRHPDAQINHPIDEVAGKVVAYIRELRPDVVITHDPIGGYKHPDHVHIHKATVLAFEKADDAAFHPEAGPPFKPRALYYRILPRGIVRWTVRLMPLLGKDPTKFGRNGDVNLRELAEVEFPVHARVDTRAVAGIKREAGAQHASQGGGVRRGPLGLLMKLFGEREEFMQAFPPIGAGFRRKADLFEGI